MKQMIRKIGMIVAALLSFLPASAYDFEVDGIYYNVTSFTDLTCNVTFGGEDEYQGGWYQGDIVIPSEVTYNNRKLKVTGIGYYAFRNCSSLSSVKIPNSVNYIGQGAFGFCTSLKSITLPNSITGIGQSAFSECKSLETIDLSSSITKIGSSTFSYCSALKTVNLGNNVTEIGQGAFGFCTSLKSITLPNSVKNIGRGAFRYTGLESITLPQFLVRLYDETFESCKSLKSINIPNGLTTIGKEVFQNCTSLKSINLPNSVTEIGPYSFWNCSALEQIKLSESMTEISEGLFGNCTSLRQLDIPGSVIKLLLYYTGGQEIYSTFYGCNQLTTLRFPYSFESLQVGYTDSSGEHFEYSWEYFPATITDLYLDRKFWSTLPALPKEYVQNLEKLELGASIEKVQVELKGLQTLNCIQSHALVPPTLGEMTNAQYMNLEVLVPDEALEEYQNAPVWKNFWNLKGFAGVGEVNDDAKTVVSRVNLAGNAVDEEYKGVVIVRYSDGSCKKIAQ